MDTVSLKLPQFEGPIELLYALVQKNEIDISSLSLNLIIDQIAKLLSHQTIDLDLGAESIGHAGNLLWIKSRALLPQNSAEEALMDDGSDLKLSMLQKLVEYCRFKDAAADLAAREEKAKESYVRPISQLEAIKKNLGLEHVTLSELAAVFQVALEKAEEHRGIIEEEEWSVSEKMQTVREKLKALHRISFDDLFAASLSKLELIVIFLAVLELMKLNELCVLKERGSLIIAAHPHG